MEGVMKTAFRIFISFFVFFAVASNSYSNEMIIAPHGLGLQMDVDDEAGFTINLTNTSEEGIRFSLDHYLAEEGEGERRGPHRDDLGDLIDSFVNDHQGIGDRFVTALAWDLDQSIMWLTFSDSREIVAVDPAQDYEEVAGFQGPGGDRDGASGAAWHEGVLYLVGWVNHEWVYRYDTEGNNIGNFNAPASVGAVATSNEDDLLFIMSSNRNIYVYDFQEDDELIGTFSDYTQFLDGQLAQSMCWVDQHPDGQLWLNSRGDDGDNNLWEICVDTEEWEAVELVQHFELEGLDMGHPRDGVAHDGENLWWSHWSAQPIRIIDDGVSELRILLAEPVEGEIEGNEFVEIQVQVFSEGLEAGVYEVILEFTFTDPGNEENGYTVPVSVVISVDSPTAEVTGTIASEAGGDPVEGARIEIDRFIIARNSNEEGEYIFERLPFGEYEFTVTAQDFLQGVYNLEIDEEGEYALDVSLLHSECTPEVDWIEEFVAPDEQITVNFTVHNGGTGPLTYTIDRRLIGDANADPWVLRSSLYVGEEVNDTYIMGAIFDGENFYVSGSNDNSPVIYIFDRDGNLQDSFDQPGDDRRGLRDLAWDGNLIWGADSDNIYGFNRAGEVQYTLDAPFSPTSNVTWDPIHQWLWVSTTTTNIIALDLNGDQQAVVDRQGLRVYGLGFYADDPDGYNLYIFAKEPDTDRPYIHKANTDEDDVMFVEYLDTEIGGSPGGVFITNEYDIYSYVMVAAINAPGNIGGDRIDIWQVDARKSWMQIDPAEGVIDAGATTEFDVVLDATGLPPEIFEGEFVFTHDGVGGETHVPVTLNVVEGPVEAELTLEFEQGWNMVSVYLQPDPEDVVALMQPLVDEDLLLLMKNGSGNFYSPVDEFCNIPGWFVDEGYLMKVTESCELTLAGITVAQDEPIDLVQGWQTISCYLRNPVDAIVALSGIVDNLVIAKDGWGNFYKPDWDFSNMGDMIHSRGYMVKMTEDTQLIYRLFLEDDELDHVQQRSVYASPGRLGVHPVTGANMSLMAIAGSGFEAPVGETEIGVYASGELVGSGILQGGRCGIAIWGDDPITSEVDGALDGESLEISILSRGEERIPVFSTLSGDGIYETDALWVIELAGEGIAPDGFALSPPYPNPFNAASMLGFNLPDAGYVEIKIYDLNGRIVEELMSGFVSAGQHSLVVDAAHLPAGIYEVELRSGGRIAVQKMVLLK